MFLSLRREGICRQQGETLPPATRHPPFELHTKRAPWLIAIVPFFRMRLI